VAGCRRQGRGSSRVLVRHLVEQGSVDPKRICIVGASYGGYAALAGAALTPELYRCAVSIAGVGDPADFIGWRKRKWGADSEGYTYRLQSIGDPDRDAAKLAATSPALLAIDRFLWQHLGPGYGATSPPRP
jgi:dipeptidyl aminopeptidase/acylaminoacyl peptidase